MPPELLAAHFLCSKVVNSYPSANLIHLCAQLLSDDLEFDEYFMHFGIKCVTVILGSMKTGETLIPSVKNYCRYLIQGIENASANEQDTCMNS